MHRAEFHTIETDLIDTLVDPIAFDHAVDETELIETHISWVILAGDYAYKIKKPVELDFLDFATLDARRHSCEEELRLNKPWAPSLYVDVVPITIPNGHPRFGGDGEVIEYAVRMKRFDQGLRLDAQLDQGRLGVDDMRELAKAIADRHHAAPRIDAGERERIVAVIKDFIRDNFGPLVGIIDGTQLNALRDWTEQELTRVDGVLWQRFDDGFVRDCHGDLHLANLVRLPDGIATYDCIEFNADLRSIDVICDVAFLTMDLVGRGRRELASHFINRYLECTGDYAGMRVFDLYFVYRCLVRAKVAAILSMERSSRKAAEADRVEARRYADMASRQIAKSPRLAVIMHGLSGSGKTWLSTQLMASLPAIRVRSDIERKRMFDVAETADSESGIEQGIYTPERTADVYRYLNDVAGMLVGAGHNVILDAAFLDRAERDAARQAVGSIPAVLVTLDAPVDVLCERLQARATQKGEASEADLAVLEYQLENEQPIAAEEARHAVRVTSTSPDVEELSGSIRELAVAEGSQ